MKHYINGTNDGVVGIDAKGQAKGQAKGLKELTIEEFNLWKTGKYEIVGDTLSVKPAEVTIESIDAQLSAIDLQSARPLRKILTANEGDDVSSEKKLLSELEALAITLRAQRRDLL